MKDVIFHFVMSLMGIKAMSEIMGSVWINVSARCLGGHGFDAYWGLFLSLMLMHDIMNITPFIVIFRKKKSCCQVPTIQLVSCPRTVTTEDYRSQSQQSKGFSFSKTISKYIVSNCEYSKFITLTQPLSSPVVKRLSVMTFMQ